MYKDEIDEEYALTFGACNHNPYGIVLMKAYGAQFGNKVFDSITIIKPVFDFRDMENKKNIKAELLENGTGMIITEPVIPHFLLHSVQAIHEQEGKDMCTMTARAHLTEATSVIRASNEQKFKKTLLWFPEGVVCTLGIFNNHVDRETPNEIKTNGRFVFSWYSTGSASHGLNGNLPLLNPYVFWKLVIKNTEQIMVEQVGDQLTYMTDAISRAHIPLPPP